MGLSIIELIAVIFVISLGLTGVLSLVIKNIEVQHINKNILAASGLAQEGLEIVRNIRDANWLIPGNDWAKDVAGASGDSTYAIDFRGRNNIIMAANNIDDEAARLYIISGGATAGLYTHEAADNTATNFYRLITVTGDPTDGYLDVKCHIRWKDLGRNYNYTAETYLYNWR